MSELMDRKPWRVGVAGLGTVGAGLLSFLEGHPEFAPGGGLIYVHGVSARSRSRPRPVDISDLLWFDDPVALAESDEIDLFVELIGGSDGPAKAAVEAALRAGKPVVTANKALIAEHGRELAELAEEMDVPLLFEAAVMGGVPAVKMVREALVGGALNALFIEGERIGRIYVQGPGAGAGPTAAAVAADIADVMTGARRPVFQAEAATLWPFTPVDPAKSIGRAYLRLSVKDEPGVIAAVSETLADAGVSIESFLQKPVDNASGVPIVLTTHAVAESVLKAAIDRIAALPAVLDRPRLLRIAKI